MGQHQGFPQVYVNIEKNYFMFIETLKLQQIISEGRRRVRKSLGTADIPIGNHHGDDDELTAHV